MRNAVVAAQALTMLALAVLFYRDGLWRLAAAQLCYLVATGVLFAR